MINLQSTEIMSFIFLVAFILALELTWYFLVRSEEVFDEAEVFSKSEIRKFVKSFRKFGPAAKRLKDIGRDAGLSASVAELDALLDILHRKCSEAEAYATNIDGNEILSHITTW